MALQDATNPMQGISGPGKFAKRTDLEYQSPEYGAGAEMAAQKGGAPLATSPDVRGAAPSTFRRDVERGAAAGAAAQEVTSLYAPSQRPNTPVTEGIDLGAGAGSEALQMRQPDDINFRSAIRAYMPVLAYVADQPNTSPETRRAIRQLRDYS